MLRILLIVIGLAVLVWLVRLGVEDRSQFTGDLSNGDAVLIEEPDFIETDDTAGIDGAIARDKNTESDQAVSDTLAAEEEAGPDLSGVDLLLPTETVEDSATTSLADINAETDEVSQSIPAIQLDPGDVIVERAPEAVLNLEDVPVTSIVTGLDDSPVAFVKLPVVNKAIPATKKLRIATYNVSLYKTKAGALAQSLAGGTDAQAKAIATIIQRTRPDVVLLNEFDYDEKGLALRRFLLEYLSVKQSGSPALAYPFAAAFPSNTGVPSGFDLDKSGVAVTQPGTREYGGDAFGYGLYPGQYGFAILSRFPIDVDSIRTFRKFKWADMPGHLMPQGFYPKEAEPALRLSSKNHVDVPIMIGEEIVHVIAAHPTPPTFDGPEDRNGRRNHDEIRLLADYVTPGKGAYIVDDAGAAGGLNASQRFVVLGDLNADPVDGAGIIGAIQQLLDSPAVQGKRAPASPGGSAASTVQAGANKLHKLPPSMDTADFKDEGPYAAGNLRLDYVLPSTTGLVFKSGGVYWPLPDSQDYELIEGDRPVSSDHRLVWLDIELQ